MAKILGIDYGDKRVGLAIGDTEIKTAVPYEIIENGANKNLIKTLKKIVRQEKIERIILGIPLSLKNWHGGNSLRQEDYDNAHMKKVLYFGDLLEEELGLPVIQEDERLSTKMAEGLAGRKRGEKYDDVAAMLILQTYLDKIK